MANVLKDFCKGYEILPLNTQIVLNFKMDGIVGYFEGKEYTVSLACSNRSVSFSIKKFMVQDGWKFNTTILSTSVGHALINISVDGVVNARFSFRFLDSKDVFKKRQYDLMTDELNYVASQLTDTGPLSWDPPRRLEYRGRSYCMGGAERGLSELLEDITNFYAVERDSDKHKNKISVAGKDAKDRGKHFEKLGLADSMYDFDSYKIINSKKNLIFNAKDEDDASLQYHNVRYSIIELTTSGKSILDQKFEADLKGKELGYHVYYLTVTDGFHTLLLVIDTITNPCHPTYEIWEQHGRTKSYGLLSDIAEGMRSQTSWTFANSCVIRYKDKRTSSVDSTNTYLWKMRRKK